ncbi:hypothetical protein [Limnoglobus roseus]|uniref:Uncharacterized protein n=1 Tax=Limnoglobus roseus TaxID=2598579 RepID=A0A5C1A8D1_9BACT|nr:hypothetical protein [Limnoglobus roseus]QEL15471.1 hypothetical protein PX52LOC_02392 [Limnoglobus roseus]
MDDVGPQVPGERLRQLLPGRHHREAEAEAKAVAEVLEAGRKLDPKYLVWWLERKLPHRWGRDRSDLVEIKKKLKDLEVQIGEVKEDASGAEQSTQD